MGFLVDNLHYSQLLKPHKLGLQNKETNLKLRLWGGGVEGREFSVAPGF